MYSKYAVHLLPRRGLLSSPISHHSQQQLRLISIQTAKSLLDLPSTTPTSSLTIKEVRAAYFAAAKRCHPDVQESSKTRQPGSSIATTATTAECEDEGEEAATHDEFLLLTQAYEVLQAHIKGTSSTQGGDDDDIYGIISEHDEAQYRQACERQLGIPAEIVEECKQNPIFRRWLAGGTDAAHTWRSFFLQNGGLAPQLRPVAGVLPAGGSPEQQRLAQRRKRRGR